MVGPTRPLVNTVILAGRGPWRREYISGRELERAADRYVPGRSPRRTPMPHYEFYCERCKTEVALTLSIGARERGEYKCPGCGGKQLQPLMGTFFSKTSRKA